MKIDLIEWRHLSGIEGEPCGLDEVGGHDRRERLRRLAQDMGDSSADRELARLLSRVDAVERGDFEAGANLYRVWIEGVPRLRPDAYVNNPEWQEFGERMAALKDRWRKRLISQLESFGADLRKSLEFGPDRVYGSDPSSGKWWTLSLEGIEPGKARPSIRLVIFGEGRRGPEYNKTHRVRDLDDVVRVTQSVLRDHLA